MTTTFNLVSKEQVLYHIFNSGYRMTRQDSNFFAHVQQLIANKRQVTSNQAHLFNKLVLKLGKQLRANGFDARQLITLPWHVPVVESTQATLRLENDTLIIETPFNKKFIDDFNSYSAREKSFEWDRTKKVHTAPFGTKALRLATTKLEKHFDIVRYCAQIQEILDTQVRPLSNDLIWNPTLVKSDDKYYIAASNNVIDKQIANIELNAEPQTLYKLSKMAIAVHPSVTNGDPFLNFAGSYDVEVNADDLDKVCEWIEQLKIPMVLVEKELTRWSDIHRELIGYLDAHDIDRMNEPSSWLAVENEFVSMRVTRINRIVMGDNKPTKNIRITNSRPVEVK